MSLVKLKELFTTIFSEEVIEEKKWQSISLISEGRFPTTLVVRDEDNKPIPFFINEKMFETPRLEVFYTVWTNEETYQCNSVDDVIGYIAQKLGV